MWPMCKRPVTFGGGSSRVNTGRVSPSGGVGTENSFSLIQYSAQRVSIAPGSYDLGSSCGIQVSCGTDFRPRPRRAQLGGSKPSLRMNFDITGARKEGSNERGEKGKTWSQSAPPGHDHVGLGLRSNHLCSV